MPRVSYSADLAVLAAAAAFAWEAWCLATASWALLNWM